MQDGLIFEESVQLAIKTIRQTPHHTLILTPFQLHFGRKTLTSIIKIIGQPECLLSNWMKTITKYILAHPAELHVFTVHESDGELATYLVVKEPKKRGRSVSENFTEYKFFETEIKPDSMKCRFKTNKSLTAVKETKHTVTTSDGKLIHKKLASNYKFSAIQEAGR